MDSEVVKALRPIETFDGLVNGDQGHPGVRVLLAFLQLVADDWHPSVVLRGRPGQVDAGLGGTDHGGGPRGPC